MNLNTIFVIVDPTSDAQPAFERGLDSARDTGASLHLYACVGEGHAEDAQATIESLAAKVSKAGLTASHEVEINDDWAERAVSAAARIGASMIFKNSVDHSTVDRERRRTADWTLLRTSPCPVLMVKNFHDWSNRTVLAAVSPASGETQHLRLDNQIISLTRQLASGFGSNAHFVTAFNDLNHPPQPADIAHKCGADESHVHVKKGKASDVVRDTAQALDADLIIVGTVGRDGIKGRVVGNTCERLLDQTHSDVLVIC